MPRISLEARVMELERRCQCMQLAVAGVMALGAIAWLSAARAPLDTTVRAQRFELVDAAGEVRGTLAFDGQSPLLELFCPEAGASAVLRAGPGPVGPREFEEVGLASLVLRHTSGSARVLAGATAVTGQDQRQLVLLEGHGPHALLVTGTDFLAQNGAPPAPHPFSTLDLRSEPGSASGTLATVRLLAAERTGTLELGTGQTPRAVLRYRDGEPSLSLEDAAGTPRFRAP